MQDPHKHSKCQAEAAAGWYQTQGSTDTSQSANSLSCMQGCMPRPQTNVSEPQLTQLHTQC